MASIDEAKEIIKSTPISTIINYYHPISKKGANYEGICPFHGDTSPSLKINDSKGIYKCFACGAAGDAIKFVMDKLGVEFVEAMKDIANNVGINIDEQKAKNKDPKFEMALRVLNASNKIYRKVATEMNPKLFSEFLKNRKITEESVQDYQLGFAPATNALTNYLNTIPDQKERKFAIETAAKIGLIRPQRSGQGHYDFYRDRVIFPICDHAGKVRGYSSRAVKPDQKPKYLNSGESFIFDKGNILYGFNLAKNHIREQDSVIIVEGNMDALMLHQFGFKNSVATMGVSLSISSIKLLSNMTKNFYLAMDSDPAGIKAMERINQDLLEADIVAKYNSFEPAKDPDEFLNTEGRLELVNRIDSAPTFIDFCIDRIIPNPIPDSTDRKLVILKDIFALLAPMKTNLFATEKLIQCAKSLGLKSSPEDIKSEYKNFLEDKPTHTKPALIIEQENEELGDDPVQQIHVTMDNVETVELTKVERNLLATFMTHPECTEGQQITEILDLIDHFEVKRVVQWLKRIYLEIDEADYLFVVQEKLKESIPDTIKDTMFKQVKFYEPTKLNQKVMDKMLEDLVFKLKEQKIKTKRDKLKLEQKQSQSDEESLEIINKIQELEKTLLELRNK